MSHSYSEMLMWLKHTADSILPPCSAQTHIHMNTCVLMDPLPLSLGCVHTWSLTTLGTWLLNSCSWLSLSGWFSCPQRDSMVWWSVMCALQSQPAGLPQQILATLGKWLNSSVTQFLHLYNGSNKNSDLCWPYRFVFTCEKPCFRLGEIKLHESIATPLKPRKS